MPRCHQRASPMEWRSPGQPDLARQADRVLLGRPQRIGRDRLLDPEPVPARGAVPGPVEPRVVAEDLDPRADDEDHQEQVEEVLQSTQTGSPASPPAARHDRCRGSGRMNSLHEARHAQALGDGTAMIRPHEADRQQPQQVEPSAATDPHPRGDPVRAGPNRPRSRFDRRPRPPSAATGSSGRRPERHRTAEGRADPQARDRCRYPPREAYAVAAGDLDADGVLGHVVHTSVSSVGCSSLCRAAPRNSACGALPAAISGIAQLTGLGRADGDRLVVVGDLQRRSPVSRSSRRARE